MGKALRIQVGVRLGLALNEIGYSVSSEMAAKFIVDIAVIKNREIEALKNAIELALNQVPEYLFCTVITSDLDDSVVVYVSADFSEEEDGGYDKWLNYHGLTEEQLSKDIEAAIQIVRNMTDCYGRHFGNNLLTLGVKEE